MLFALGLVIESCLASAVFADTRTFDIKGFKVEISNYSMEAQGDLLILKGKGTLDLSAVFGSGAVVTSENVTLDSNGNGVLQGVSTPSISAGGFSGRIASGDISFKHGEDAHLNVKVILNFNIGGSSSEIVADLPITPQGIQDTTIALNPPPGQAHFFSQSTGESELTLTSGEIQVRNGRFSQASFSGSMRLFGSDMTLTDVVVSADGISGKASGGIDIGVLKLTISEDMEFSYHGAGAFSADIPAAAIDISKVVDGANPISITGLTYADGLFNAEADINQTVGVDGAQLTLTHISITSENKADGSVLLKATIDGKAAIGGATVAFSGMKLDSDGNVSGTAVVSPPQTVTMLGMSQTISSVTFSNEGGAISFSLSGAMSFGDGQVAFKDLGMSSDGKINGTFDASESNPIGFAWMPPLKITGMNITDDVLKFSGKIVVPEPFPYTFKFDQVEVRPDGTVITTMPESARRQAEKKWKQVTDPALITLENADTTPFKAGGFSFSLDAITIPNPLLIMKGGKAPETLLTLYMKSELPVGEDKSVSVLVDGVEFTRAGVKDLFLDIGPGEGQTSMLSLDLDGWARLDIKGAFLSVKQQKVETFGLSGARLEFPKMSFGLDFERIEFAPDGSFSAKAKFTEPLSFPQLGFEFSLTEASFKYDKKALLDRLSFSAAGSLGIGGFKTSFSEFSLKKGLINLKLEYSESNPLTFDWFPFLKITRLDIIDNKPKFDGKLALPEPINFDLALKGIAIDFDLPTLNIPEFDIPSFEIPGFKCDLSVLRLPNFFATLKLGKLPDILLDVDFNVNMDFGFDIPEFTIPNIKFGKIGMFDMDFDLMALPGMPDLFNFEIPELARVSVKSAKISIKDKKFQGFKITNAALTILQPSEATIGFDLLEYDQAKKQLSGKATITDSGLKFDVGGVKLSLGDEISFTYAKNGPFAFTVRNASMDMTSLLGSSAKATLNEFTYSDGDIFADVSAPVSVDLQAVKLGLTRLKLESKRPAAKNGDRLIKVIFDGSLEVPSIDLELEFKEFAVSNQGKVEGDINLPCPQRFEMFGVDFVLKGARVALASGKMEITVKGGLSFGESAKYDFDNLKIINGIPSLEVRFDEKNPLPAGFSKFITINRLVLSTDKLALDGAMDIKAVGIKLIASNIVINKNGQPESGMFKLGNKPGYKIGGFGFEISNVSYDLKTAYLSYGGKVILPQGVGDITFDGMGLSLGSGTAKQDSSKMKSKSGCLKVSGLEFCPRSVNFGEENGINKFIFSGSVGLKTGGLGGELDFTNLKIGEDFSIDVDKIAGSLSIGGNTLSIRDFGLNDTDPDPYVYFSGGLTIGGFGAEVDDFQIHRSGKMYMSGIGIAFKGPTYAFNAKLSWKDMIFKGNGTLIIGPGGQSLGPFSPQVDASFLIDSPNSRIKIDLEAKNLNLQLGPLSITKLYGGMDYNWATKVGEFRIGGEMVFVTEFLMHGKVDGKYHTDGYLDIEASVVLVKAIPLADFKLHADFKTGDFTMKGRAGVDLYGVVTIMAEIEGFSRTKTIEDLFKDFDIAMTPGAVKPGGKVCYKYPFAPYFGKEMCVEQPTKSACYPRSERKDIPSSGRITNKPMETLLNNYKALCPTNPHLVPSDMSKVHMMNAMGGRYKEGYVPVSCSASSEVNKDGTFFFRGFKPLMRTVSYNNPNYGKQGTYGNYCSDDCNKKYPGTGMFGSVTMSDLTKRAFCEADKANVCPRTLTRAEFYWPEPYETVKYGEVVYELQKRATIKDLSRFREKSRNLGMISYFRENIQSPSPSGCWPDIDPVDAANLCEKAFPGMEWIDCIQWVSWKPWEMVEELKKTYNTMKSQGKSTSHLYSTQTRITGSGRVSIAGMNLGSINISADESHFSIEGRMGVDLYLIYGETVIGLNIYSKGAQMWTNGKFGCDIPLVGEGELNWSGTVEVHQKGMDGNLNAGACIDLDIMKAGCAIGGLFGAGCDSRSCKDFSFWFKIDDKGIHTRSIEDTLKDIFD